MNLDYFSRFVLKIFDYFLILIGSIGSALSRIDNFYYENKVAFLILFIVIFLIEINIKRKIITLEFRHKNKSSSDNEEPETDNYWKFRLLVLALVVFGSCSTSAFVRLGKTPILFIGYVIFSFSTFRKYLRAKESKGL